MKEQKRKPETPVRLFDEADDKVEDRVAYEIFEMRALDIEGEVDGHWFNHNGKKTMFLYKGSRERAQEHIDKAEYRDFGANEERLAYFRAFLWAWRKLDKQSKKIGEIADELKTVGEKDNG